MVPPAPRSASRYRRRILGIGALATLALYVIGAPIFNGRIEDDLEQRVPDELAAQGYDGISASFSGQDGDLACAQPLDDPEAVVEAAYGVWGVRQIELERSCRVNRAPLVETTTTTPATATTVVADGAATTIADTSPSAVTTTTTTLPPGFATVAEAVATDSRLSLLSVLIQESGLASTLTDPTAAPVTLFAPTDAAFDELEADVIAGLRADPELLDRVLGHHLVSELVGSGDLVAGRLTTVDGGSLDVAVDGDSITVDGASIVTPDVAAGNGLVHVIDPVLVPADVELSPLASPAELTVTWDGGVLTFDGLVASEVDRALLVGSAGDATVADQLFVDPDVGVDAATAEALAPLIAAMSANLLDGVVGFDGTGLYVNGTYATEAGRDAVAAVADTVGATLDLQPPPLATPADAAELEEALNAYVTATPILFEPSSAVLSPSAVDVVGRVALDAQRFSGIAIAVEGHTDSDGDPTDNLVLSQLRANAVRDALVVLGIDGAAITAEGFGSEQPVVVDGVEDKDASRRVEFRVVASS